MKPDVEVGQVYKDKDKRMENRHVKVVSVDEQHAYCVDVRADGSRITQRRRRMLCSGLQSRFELVSA